MVQALVALGVIGGVAALGRRPGAATGLGAALPQNKLCYFEIWEGQEELIRDRTRQHAVWGNPIRCMDRYVQIKALVGKLKQYEGSRGNPKIACRFPLVGHRKGIGLGVARDCRKVKK